MNAFALEGPAVEHRKEAAVGTVALRTIPQPGPSQIWNLMALQNSCNPEHLALQGS